MTLNRLKWAFLPALFVFLVVIDDVRGLLRPHFDSRLGNLVMDGVVALAILFFVGAAFTVITNLRTDLVRQNKELLALHHAALDIHGELALETVLQKVVDQARLLLEAHYGAVSVVDEEGRISQFVTSGISHDHRELIGAPPQGRGLLGVPLRAGQRLRLPDLEKDPRAAGFPPHHPRMHSLLAVPILAKGTFRGNLYLADKETAPEFSEADEQTLVRFATAAAIAVDNARLHQRLRLLAIAEERVRIAREMHDGMAQVLAYVNTKAQAVQEYLAREKVTEATAQLEQLAAAAREVYTDVREGILALRTKVGDGLCQGALQDFIGRWQDQAGIAAELKVNGDIRLPPVAEIQLLRIIQEALSTVRKHSRADRASVTFEDADGHLVVTIEDNGAGFDPAARHRGELPRFGLAIMRERAESIGAQLTLDSAPGAGTRVRVELPGVSPSA